jgi:hypothetical protein
MGLGLLAHEEEMRNSKFEDNNKWKTTIWNTCR